MTAYRNGKPAKESPPATAGRRLRYLGELRYSRAPRYFEQSKNSIIAAHVSAQTSESTGWPSGVPAETRRQTIVEFLPRFQDSWCTERFHADVLAVPLPCCAAERNSTIVAPAFRGNAGRPTSGFRRLRGNVRGNDTIFRLFK